MAGFLFTPGVKTALFALAAAAALPCLADRVFEMRGAKIRTDESTITSVTNQVPEGKYATLIGINKYCGYTWCEFQRPGHTNLFPCNDIGKTIPGPATIVLTVTTMRGYPCDGTMSWVLFREWEASPSLPETAPVVPAGDTAVLTIESSSDLKTWQPAIVTNLPAATTNRFFRMKLR